jgi:hypothetical protein
MLVGVQTHRTLLRVFTALFAAMLLLVAAPIHAAHGHDASAPSSTLQASCAVCQMHAPVGTPAGASFAIIQLEAFDHFTPAATDVFVRTPRDDTDACRAPPSLAS